MTQIHQFPELIDDRLFLYRHMTRPAYHLDVLPISDSETEFRYSKTVVHTHFMRFKLVPDFLLEGEHVPNSTNQFYRSVTLAVSFKSSDLSFRHESDDSGRRAEGASLSSPRGTQGAKLIGRELEAPTKMIGDLGTKRDPAKTAVDTGTMIARKVLIFAVRGHSISPRFIES